MNKQRELIYGQRNRVLDGEDIKETVHKMIAEVIEAAVEMHLEGDVPDLWNFDNLRNYFRGWLADDNDLKYSVSELNRLEKEDIAQFFKDRAFGICEKKEEEYGSEVMREIERICLLRSVDMHWMDHIDAMDELRQGIGLRAYGQHNPVVEYRNEGYEMFNAMTEGIREDTVKGVICTTVRRDGEAPKRQKVAEEENTDKNTTVRGKGVVSKNALCPCGSGLKYKRCCGKGID
jgi:preprotein translocase subunit SecA